MPLIARAPVVAPGGFKSAVLGSRMGSTGSGGTGRLRLGGNAAISLRRLATLRAHPNGNGARHPYTQGGRHVHQCGSSPADHSHHHPDHLGLLGESA
jgi:hypothetical protein